MLLLKGSTVKHYNKNRWDADFNTITKYHYSIFKIWNKYTRNYRKIKKIFNLNKCAEVYNMLCDEYSKDLYLKILMYRLFDDGRCKYPLLYNKDLNACWSKYDYLISDNTQIEVINGTLHKYNLKPINKNIEIIFGNKLAFFIAFILEQYNYRDFILPKPQDVVIDGGACYGDTALFFADKMSGQGKIYSFEFMPQNLSIFKDNLTLNPQYSDNIEIVEKALSDKEEVFYSQPQASMSFIEKEQKENSIELKTTTIDNFVKEKSLNRVDFIKLDIEGFEIEAITGATKTIKDFKPKLAICLYHKKEDLYEIPLLIKSIEPNYKFYIDHYTVNTEETVLYGVIE